MEKLENKEINNNEIYNENNGLYYTKVGDYYPKNLPLFFKNNLNKCL